MSARLQLFHALHLKKFDDEEISAAYDMIYGPAAAPSAQVTQAVTILALTLSLRLHLPKYPYKLSFSLHLWNVQLLLSLPLHSYSASTLAARKPS